MELRQSDLKLWQKCPLQYRFAKIDLLPRLQGGSATFGSIIHDCTLWMETHRDADGVLDLAGAVERFHYFWDDPTRLAPDLRIDYYENGRNWRKFHDQGPTMLKNWWSIIQWDTALVLGREHQFDVPIGNGHVLHGTIDKLELRFWPALNSYVVMVSDYKGLALDTPLPTPTGWTAMGAVQVGDRVLGGDGLPCVVTAKSEVHLRDCYRITFDDGSSVVADNEHLWRVETSSGTKILATELATNLKNPATGQRHLKIANVATVLPRADLPIDPYVLGAWLGDGTRGTGVITKPLPTLFAEIERRGYRIGPLHGNGGRTVYGLRPQLRQLGALDEKRVPDEYLRASEAQRLDLLRGIMDTDGHWNSTRRRCVVNTTDERFARQVYELAVSLGWKAATFATTAKGFGLERDAWQTWFTPVDAVVFSARVPEDYRSNAHVKSRRRLIMSVEQVPTVSTQCIAVDSPENTYLCGEQMVETHNTNAKVPTYGYLAEDLQFSAYCYATTRPEFWTDIPNGAALFQQYQDLPRRGEWVSLVQPRRMDAEERIQRHYNRLTMAVDALALSVAMRIFVPNISGESCRYCEFRAQCGLPELMES